MHIKRLFKTGNSLVVSIPSYMKNTLSLQRGDSVSVETHDESSFIVRKIDLTKLNKDIKTNG